MDFQSFLHHLPTLYSDWATTAVQPRSPQFQVLLGQVPGRTAPAVMQLLNAAIAAMPAQEVYCEIGCGEGATLVGALWQQPDRMAYAVDTSGDKSVLQQLTASLEQTGLQDQVCICSQSISEFFHELQLGDIQDRIGVYFYRGTGDYRSHLLGLLQARPFLAEQALIVVTQAASGMVRQAVWDFLACSPETTLLLDLSTQTGVRSGFWDGLLILGWDRQAPAASDTLPVESDVIEGLETLHLASQQQWLMGLRQQAVQLHMAGKYPDAERLYQQVLMHEPNNAEVWLNLGMLYDLTQEAIEALSCIQQSLRLDPHNPVAHHMHGLVLDKQAQTPAAIAAYQAAIQLQPDYIDALNRLGELYNQAEQWTEAEACYRQSLAVDPQQLGSHIGLGDALVGLHRDDDAITAYRQALTLKPLPLALEKLQSIYETQGQTAKALYAAGRKFYHQGQPEQAVAAFRQFLQLEGQFTQVIDYFFYFFCLRNCGYIQAAIEALEGAARLSQASPAQADPFLQIAPRLVLPYIYDSVEELDAYHQDVVQALDRLEQQYPTQADWAPYQNLSGFEYCLLFHFSYQGYNCRSALAQYGRMLGMYVASKYPYWVQPLVLPPIAENGKIRIGYIAEELDSSSMTRWALGWLKYCDRSQFEIYSYSLKAAEDLASVQFKGLSDHYYQFNSDFHAACRQIRSDQLHILVSLAVGTSIPMAQMGCLRLAPIQCSAWGHPVTSGLPEIDYFLAGDLMEPENAAEHYTEELIRLPNLGISYTPPEIKPPSKHRADFGIREDAVAYLSCQLMFKYLPQHDHLFVEIAQRVPNAQLIFVLRSTRSEQPNPNLEAQFRRRLSRAFDAVGLRLEDYCLFLAGQDWQDYTSLLQSVDVFLDTPAFSAGHTAFDAIAAGLPIVTLPGEFMRGRQTYGMLRLMGATETIAQTEADYIEIAARLGLEPAWRQAIATDLHHDAHRLFEDTTCVQGLEAFYRQVVQEKLADQHQHCSQRKQVLHVGCGPYKPDGLPGLLQGDEWQEIRLDINPEVKPDIIGSMTDMSAVPSQTINVVFSSHNLEHLYYHEVPIALGEFYRVLKPGGFALVTLPDMQAVAVHVAEGHLEDPLYMSSVGSISAIDVMYGWRSAIAEGNHFMAHRTAFTAHTLQEKFEQAGFTQMEVHHEGFDLWMRGYKS